jgi:hypothetical protein
MKDTNEITKDLFWQYKHRELEELFRHQDARKRLHQDLKSIQASCDHVFDKELSGLPDIGYEVCEICGYEQHKPN